MDVCRLGFAPIKGTRHEEYDEVRLDEVGPVGDRRWCVVDVAARQVLRTVQNPSLVAIVARTQAETLELRLPSGEVVAAPPEPTDEVVTCDYWGRPVDLTLTDGPHAAALSALLRRPVRLAQAPPSSVVYGAPVSLVSTASLRDLAGRAGRSDLLATSARFRLTLVVDAGDVPYVEDSWIGAEVEVGEVRLAVRAQVPRCAVIDRDPLTGVPDGSLLKTLAGYRPGRGTGPPLGVDATVVTPGVLRRARSGVLAT